MFKVFRNAWKIDDLRKKILFTVFVIVLFRLGSNIPVPFLNPEGLDSLFGFQDGAPILSFLNIMAGGAMEKAAFFALSISPYINASIIMQLLAVAIPALERIMKEDGERGRKIMEKWTRILTVVLSIVLGFGYYTLISTATNDGQALDVVTKYGGATDVFIAIVITACFAAGAMVVMWLGELINEKGIGNGISVILFAGIISGGSSMIAYGYSTATTTKLGWLVVLLVTLGALAMVAFVVFMTNGERRIPVQYAKKVVGRKMYGGQSTNIPLKVNMTGVLPIIFAQSFVTLPATLGQLFGWNTGWFGKVVEVLSPGPKGWAYTILMFLLIIFFSYFYTVITFNPVEVASNLKKNGGFIMGIRPGKPTSDYITKTLNRVTLIGALFLGIISALPNIAAMFNQNFASLAIGGTSLLIVVGVALETVKSLESQMLMRHYKGFLE